MKDRFGSRRRDLVLDFTALLDIVLLLLFFFLLYSHYEVQTAEEAASARAVHAEAQAEADQQAAEREIAEARRLERQYQELLTENAALKQQYERDLQTLAEVSARSGGIAAALNGFVHDNNLKLMLVPDGSYQDQSSDRLLLRVMFRQDVIASYDYREVTADDLVRDLTGQGLSSNSVIMCDFVYDGDAVDSSDAYRKVRGILEELRNGRGYLLLYVSETDFSKGRTAEDHADRTAPGPEPAGSASAGPGLAGSASAGMERSGWQNAEGPGSGHAVLNDPETEAAREAEMEQPEGQHGTEENQ